MTPAEIPLIFLSPSASASQSGPFETPCTLLWSYLDTLNLCVHVRLYMCVCVCIYCVVCNVGVNISSQHWNKRLCIFLSQLSRESRRAWQMAANEANVARELIAIRYILTLRKDTNVSSMVPTQYAPHSSISSASLRRG